MKIDLGNREDIKYLVNPHQLMWVFAGKLRDDIALIGVKQIKTFAKKSLAANTAAVILHGFCNRLI